jgi:hypothetical protein
MTEQPRVTPAGPGDGADTDTDTDTDTDRILFIGTDSCHLSLEA